MEERRQKLVILIADDNKHDILATRRAWKAHKITNPLYVVRDGEECMDYLHRRGAYTDPESAPWPDLLLLDLKMPKLDGLGVLKAIREDQRLQQLPVVMLTTSDDDEDRLKSYNLGVNAYIRKPVGFDNFASAMRTINLFWELVLVREEHHED